MIKGISKRVWLAAILAALSVVRVPFAEGAKDATVSEPPKGMLTASKKQVVVGDTVHLLLTISGGEGLRACTFEQPVLPALAHLDLLTVGQRNALSFRSGGPVFMASFLYALKARSPGVEKIPSVQVKYRDGGEGDSRTVTVAGVEIEIVEGRGLGGRVIALIVLVVAGGVLLFVVWRMCARIRKNGKSRMPEHDGIGAAEKEKSRRAVEALAMIEGAQGLKMEGEWGEYGVRIAAALTAYLQRESSPEIEKLKGDMDALCERVRYARDRDAERDIEECTRKAELFFKNKIRESIGTRMDIDKD